jgi:hypothetical protein
MCMRWDPSPGCLSPMLSAAQLERKRVAASRKKEQKRVSDAARGQCLQAEDAERRASHAGDRRRRRAQCVQTSGDNTGTCHVQSVLDSVSSIGSDRIGSSDHRIVLCPLLMFCNCAMSLA